LHNISVADKHQSVTDFPASLYIPPPKNTSTN
jgi:hypothetical protein